MRVELEDEIHRLIRADVFQAVQFVGRFKNDSARRHDVRLVALQRRERALLHDHQLLVRVPVRRVRRFARIERRDVALEIAERRRGRIKDRAALALFRRHGLEVGPVEDARMHQRFDGGGLRERHARDGNENGNGSHDHIATGDFHELISATNGKGVKRTNVRGNPSRHDAEQH